MFNRLWREITGKEHAAKKGKPHWRVAYSHGERADARLRPAEEFLKYCPEYEPEKWNKFHVKHSTNCYAYAADDPLGHDYNGKPGPGHKFGKEIKRVTGEAVVKHAERDGMIFLGMKPEMRKGYFLVGLAIDEGLDYHWYRLGRDGLWSHKPGHGDATNLDESGKIIRCPELCNRGRYEEFYGYMLVPSNGLEIGKKARLSKKDNHKNTGEKLAKKAAKLGVEFLSNKSSGGYKAPRI